MKEISCFPDEEMMTTKWKSASCDLSERHTRGDIESLGKFMESTQAQGSERGDVMKYSL